MSVRRPVVVMLAALCALVFGGLTVGASTSDAAVYSNACSSFGWPALCAADTVSEPIGVAVDNSSAPSTKGDVYVVELGSGHRLLSFNSAGESLSSFELVSAANPVWDAIDPTTGDIYVSFLASPGVIDKFKPDGKLEESFGTEGQLTGLENTAGVAVQQSSGNLFFAVRNTESATSEILEYNSSGTTKLESFTGAGDPIDGIAVDKNGNVYVDIEGATVTEFPAGKRTAPVLIDSESPKAVAVDQSTGDVYISQNGGSEIAVFKEGETVPFETFGAGELVGEGSLGIGINETTHTVYASDRSEGLGEIFTLGLARFPLTVEKTGTASGEVTSTPAGIACGPHCQGGFEEGTKVKLKETPGEGSSFAGWAGCEAEPSGECEVTMSAGRTVTAVFNESPSAPLIEAESAISLGHTTVTLTGTVNPKNETPIACAFQYALEAALLSSGPSVAECVPAAGELGNGRTGVGVNANVEGLQPNSTYYYRLTASNGTGTGEGAVQQLLTLPDPPIVQTGEASQIQPYSATISGTVNPGASGYPAQDNTTYWFRYSVDNSYDIQVPLTQGVVGEGTSPVTESAQLSALAPDTTYHYRIMASNDKYYDAASNVYYAQVSYGEGKEFTTPATPPILGETSVSAITASGASFGGTLNAEGLATLYALRLGTEKGSLQATASGRTSANGAQPLTFTLSSLLPGTTYYYQLFAENADGTVHSPEGSFTTMSAPVVQTQLVQSFPEVVLLGVPANGFPPEEAGVIVTKTTHAGRCPKGEKRSHGSCVKVKPKHKAKKGKGKGKR
jgi:hypothetical protein